MRERYYILILSLLSTLSLVVYATSLSTQTDLEYTISQQNDHIEYMLSKFTDLRNSVLSATERSELDEIKGIALLLDEREKKHDAINLLASCINEKNGLLRQVPFLTVAENLSSGHEYIRGVYDCTEFSQACSDRFIEMGYPAHQLVVRVNCSSGRFNCTDTRYHALTLIHVPVECTPPNVHLIPPSEFPDYGITYDLLSQQINILYDHPKQVS